MRNTKEELIMAGAGLFNVKSYQGTGINDILKAVNVPKGSFYHFFSSKEDFGLAIVDYHCGQSARLLADTLGNPALPPLARMRKFMETTKQALSASQFTQGCPFGTLAQEMSALSEPMRKQLEAAFSMSREALSRCIKEGQNDGSIKNELDPAVSACFVFSALEGALLAAKTARSTTPLDNMMIMILDKLLAV